MTSEQASYGDNVVSTESRSGSNGDATSYSTTSNTSTPSRSVNARSVEKSQSSMYATSSSSSSEEPRKFRLLSDMYNETQEVKLE